MLAAAVSASRFMHTEVILWRVLSIKTEYKRAAEPSVQSIQCFELRKPLCQ